VNYEKQKKKIINYGGCVVSIMGDIIFLVSK